MAEGLGLVDGGDAGDSGDHHAGEKLHGGYVAFIEGPGGGGENFEDAKSAAIVAQRRD